MEDLGQTLGAWREAWIAKMIQRSQHPTSFWDAVVDRLVADRKRLGRDPQLPVEHSALEWSAAFKMLDQRNQEAINLEMTGRLDEALIVYEAGLADHFSSLSPYDRLRNIYTNRGWYKDALRVCLEYIGQSERPGMNSHDYFRGHAIQLANRLRLQGMM